MKEEGEPFPEFCDYCGAAFEVGVQYPTLTEEGEDGVVQIYTFYDEECRSAWRNTADVCNSK